MSDHPPPDNEVESLMSVLTKHINTGAFTNERAVAALRDDLLAREDKMKDWLLMAASDLGAMPGLTAEVIAGSGLGTPIDSATRTAIHDRFHETIDALRRDQQGPSL